jgi:hypothetical protein
MSNLVNNRAEAIFLALIVSVGLGLGVAWLRVRNLNSDSTGANRTVIGALVVSTVSYLFFLSSFLSPDMVLGPAFGERRSVVLYMNCGLALVTFGISIAKRSALRLPVAFANFALLLVWLLVGAFSSSV